MISDRQRFSSDARLEQAPPDAQGTLPRRNTLVGLAAVALSSLGLAGKTGFANAQQANRLQPQLRELAHADRSWVQVAVAAGGRRFVNFSRWFGPLDMAVAEVDANGTLRPFPNTRFNSTAPAIPAGERAVSVQSVVSSADGKSLWIVDAGNPQLAGRIAGAAKLVQVNLAMNRIVRIIPLDDHAAPDGAYLADVRIDEKSSMAFLPDLAIGALVVVNLKTGKAWRHLVGHRSTVAEDLNVMVAGRPWLYADGSRPRTAVTSIAISPDSKYLYYKALVGESLYRVPLQALIAPDSKPAEQVQKVLKCHPSDAMNFGPDGALYMTAIDRHSITRVRPNSGRAEVFISDPKLAWPVGLAFGPDGTGYTTVGRIHESMTPTDRYRLYSFNLKG
jgi:hypothetical protein